MANQNPFLVSILAGVLGGLLTIIVVLQQPNLLNRLAGATQTNISGGGNPVRNEDLSAANYEQEVTQTVEQAQPAVVTIVITQDVPIIERYFEEQPFDPFGDFFSPFGFRVPQEREIGREEREVGGGSGFIVSADGMIVTNRHVVDQDEAQYTVFLSDGTKYEAEVVAIDPANDVAILDIDANNLTYLEFADSENIKVGQTAIAIGNALGEFRNTVSVGVVSGLSRSIIAGTQFGQTEQLDEVIQTDAAINPGNSGGPLLSLEGKVIGVNVAVAQGSENIGFALPANLVQQIVQSVEETGRIVRPYLGVRYMPVTPAVQEANSLPVDYGMLIVRGSSPEELGVTPGSPANKAGIQEGDIILELDGQRLTEETSLASIIGKKNVSDTVQLKIWSRGEERTVEVTLEEFPSSGASNE